MKYFFLLAIILMVHFKVFSTCIIILRTGDVAFIAADSKRSMYAFDSNGDKIDVKSRSTCKIHHIGSFYFAISGLNDSLILEGAMMACKKSNNMDSVIKYFDLFMKNKYFESVIMLRNISKSLYNERFYGKSHGISNVVFIHQSKRGINTAVIDHYINNENEEPVNISMINRDIRNQPIICLGYCDNVYKYNPEKEVSIIGAIKHMIEAEINKNSDYVGYPIKILQINMNSHKWVYGKEPCVF